MKTTFTALALIGLLTAPAAAQCNAACQAEKNLLRAIEGAENQSRCTRQARNYAGQGNPTRLEYEIRYQAEFNRCTESERRPARR